MSEYLRRYFSPTPFESALMVGASMDEAIAEARVKGGGLSFREFHLNTVASETLKENGWAPAFSAYKSELMHQEVE